jgi:hypothetical protein
MNNIVWIQTPNVLINLCNIDLIGFDTNKDEIVINLFFNNQANTPIPIAKLNSQKAALKYMAVLSKLIKSNVKCIDSNLIADQCNNNTESDI